MKYFLFIFVMVLSVSCSQNQIQNHTLTTYSFHTPSIGPVDLGAFSGLSFSHQNPNGELVFWSLTDRGPNADSFKDAERGTVRPFLLPEYQPRILELTVNPHSKEGRISQQIPLKLPNGLPMTGRPNFPPIMGRSGDEFPATTEGKSLAYDKNGIDPEGICLLNGKFWVSEEYGPSLLQFNRQGRLLKRLVPEGYMRQGKPESFVKEVLPQKLLTRQQNRGFEGIACGEGKIYAAIQSPLPIDGKNILILEILPKHNQVLRSFFYPLDSINVDKIGDMTYHNGKLYLIEQNSNTGSNGIHQVYEFDTKTREKKLVLDLVAGGFDYEKVEGLTFTDKNEIAVVNDNDFGVINKAAKSYLGIFSR